MASPGSAKSSREEFKGQADSYTANTDPPGFSFGTAGVPTSRIAIEPGFCVKMCMPSAQRETLSLLSIGRWRRSVQRYVCDERGLPGLHIQDWLRRAASPAMLSAVPAARLKVRPNFLTMSHQPWLVRSPVVNRTRRDADAESSTAANTNANSANADSEWTIGTGLLYIGREKASAKECWKYCFHRKSCHGDPFKSMLK